MQNFCNFQRCFMELSFKPKNKKRGEGKVDVCACNKKNIYRGFFDGEVRGKTTQCAFLALVPPANFQKSTRCLVHSLHNPLHSNQIVALYLFALHPSAFQKQHTPLFSHHSLTTPDGTSSSMPTLPSPSVFNQAVRSSSTMGSYRRIRS